MLFEIINNNVGSPRNAYMTAGMNCATFEWISWMSIGWMNEEKYMYVTTYIRNGVLKKKFTFFLQK